MTDPIADMLTRIRNGSRARLQRVDVLSSRMSQMLSAVLKEQGYIDDFRQIKGKSHDVIELKLRYDEKRTPVISEIKRISKPGRRVYYRSQEIPKIRSGHGVMILTTSRGLMTDHSARKEKVGGEALCAIW